MMTLFIIIIVGIIIIWVGKGIFMELDERPDMITPYLFVGALVLVALFLSSLKGCNG